MGTVTKTKKKTTRIIKPTKTKEKITFADWDPTEVIETKEDVISLLEVTLEENGAYLVFCVNENPIIFPFPIYTKFMTSLARKPPEI